MKPEITAQLVAEHRIILRMLTILEQKAALAEQGQCRDYGFFLDAVSFSRNFADRFHHAKEEDILFEALVKNGMPRNNSPVAAMLMEHDAGRNYVKSMEAAAREAMSGLPGYDGVIAENARGYLELLREHIAREDDILYPLAERLIPEPERDTIAAAYAAADEAAPEALARYEAMVAQLEAAGPALVA